MFIILYKLHINMKPFFTYTQRYTRRIRNIIEDEMFHKDMTITFLFICTISLLGSHDRLRRENRRLRNNQL